jgi:hypothetical protein
MAKVTQKVRGAVRVIRNVASGVKELLSESSSEEIRKRYNELQATWVTSGTRARVVDILSEHKPEGGWDIDRAFVFGIGNFAVKRKNCDGVGDKQTSSLLQLAVFLDIVDKCKF